MVRKRILPAVLVQVTVLSSALSASAFISPLLVQVTVLSSALSASAFISPLKHSARYGHRPANVLSRLYQTIDKDDNTNGCAPGEKDCDLAEVLQKDLEEGYNRRNGKTEEVPATKLEDALDSILETTFYSRKDLSGMRSMFLGKRSYAQSKAFQKENLAVAPQIEDLFPNPTPIRESFYLSLPSAIITFLVSAAVFPFISNILVAYVDIPPDKLDQINSKLVPGISILYGTFISLTLSILYNRQRQVQDSIAQETSLLSFLLHNMVSLFRRDRNRMVRSGQYAADQVRILLKENRGIEYMNLIYTDPYMKMLELVEEEEERLVEEHGDFLSKGALTCLLLVGYFFSVLPTVDELGYVPFESTVLFGTLSTVYLLFYFFASDLNDLYNGVFQIRRGSSASHLLEIKKTVADHPWLKFEVSFERVNREILCFYPGLADVWFESEQNFQPGGLR